ISSVAVILWRAELDIDATKRRLGARASAKEVACACGPTDSRRSRAESVRPVARSGLHYAARRREPARDGRVSRLCRDRSPELRPKRDLRHLQEEPAAPSPHA